MSWKNKWPNIYTQVTQYIDSQKLHTQSCIVSTIHILGTTGIQWCTHTHTHTLHYTHSNTSIWASKPIQSNDRHTLIHKHMNIKTYSVQMNHGSLLGSSIKCSKHNDTLNNIMTLSTTTQGHTTTKSDANSKLRWVMKMNRLLFCCNNIILEKRAETAFQQWNCHHFQIILKKREVY